ncbi:alpha/beta hydrolase [Erythrobacter crassostreae]|uniref:Alpha/beta fold hydrolase n=1 Tax=Erythrobacter crassostreae TaxID=2828328 RepID=A0A9X1F3L2_9SPHN|nr:alpha/beta fold hydrolase [Erythrobacter crassostrea]MBV7258693.1 alpha/beta fold hydrolase [Erythrobacter crassostrea]
MKWLKNALIMVATAYIAVLAILWTFQSHFIYPAPQSPAALTPGYGEVTLTTSDGLKLRSFYLAAEPDQPTIVYFHGNAGTLEAASISNAAFAEAGFGVLMVEYRGYGGNPGDPSEQGFYRDGDAAMRWLTDQGFTNDEIIVVANSIGGGVGTEMALRHDPAALVLIAPFTSLPDAAQSNLWWLPARSLVREQYDNAGKIVRLDMPILIQHGTNDFVVPYEHGQALARLTVHAEFQTFEGSGHGLSFAGRSQIARRDWILSLGNEP